MADSDAVERFRAAAQRIELLRRAGASPEALDEASLLELIALIEALHGPGFGDVPR